MTINKWRKLKYVKQYFRQLTEKAPIITHN